MKFSDKDLQSFIALHKEVSGMEIDRAEALRQASALVRLVRRTYRPITFKQFEETLAKMKKYR